MENKAINSEKRHPAVLDYADGTKNIVNFEEQESAEPDNGEATRETTNSEDHESVKLNNSDDSKDGKNSEEQEPAQQNDIDVTKKPMQNGAIQRKRKLSLEADTSKRARLHLENEHSLVMFPDDILLIILSYLKHGSLVRLKSACTLFSRLCSDHTFWRDVDFTDIPATVNDLEEISKLVNDKTRTIRVLGKFINIDTLEDTVSEQWLLKIRRACPDLETLALPNHFINCDNIHFNVFPPSITCLDLSNTRLRNVPLGRSYFKDISILLPNLITLILSKCDWFEPHSLMAISKCDNLQELRLNDCVQVKDCLAYCGLSTRGGFKALKTLDVRRCKVTSSELVCFSSVLTLTSLVLENTRAHGAYSNICIKTAILILFTKNDHLQLNGDDGDGPDVRNFPTRPYLRIENLTIRHFATFKDPTLLRLARDAVKLMFLDVTGCGVTRNGIENFKNIRPDVTLIHQF